MAACARIRRPPRRPSRARRSSRAGRSRRRKGDREKDRALRQGCPFEHEGDFAAHVDAVKHRRIRIPATRRRSRRRRRALPPCSHRAPYSRPRRNRARARATSPRLGHRHDLHRRRLHACAEHGDFEKRPAVTRRLDAPRVKLARDVRRGDEVPALARLAPLQKIVGEKADVRLIASRLRSEATVWGSGRDSTTAGRRGAAQDAQDAIAIAETTAVESARGSAVRMHTPTLPLATR